jgi:hypothetical protein
MLGVCTNPTGNIDGTEEGPSEINQLETNQGLPDRDTRAKELFDAVTYGNKDTVHSSWMEDLILTPGAQDLFNRTTTLTDTTSLARFQHDNAPTHQAYNVQESFMPDKRKCY